MQQNYNTFFDQQEIDGIAFEVVSLGKLYVPTGAIMVCDPLVMIEQAKPLEDHIAPGEYEVSVSIVTRPEWGRRYAFARLQTGEQKATLWKSAYENESLGFPVDAGLASFSDAESQARYIAFSEKFLAEHPGGNMFDDCLAAEFKKNADPSNGSDAGDWLNFTIPGDDRHNIIMFQSGFGDGVYTCYWGLNAQGKIIELVIDFEVVA